VFPLAFPLCCADAPPPSTHPHPEKQRQLQTFQRNLKNELVELINNDYADFINLSTNLSGIDKACIRCLPTGSPVDTFPF